MRRFLLILFLLPCLAYAQAGVKKHWLPPEAVWQSARGNGATLTDSKGVVHHITAKAVINLLDARDKLRTVSGIDPVLAVVETETPNAFALVHNDRPTVAFSISYLQKVGEDAEALAATLGHELAHIHLGHSGAAREQREAGATVGANALGILLNLVGVPLGGYIANAGVTAFSRSFTRDEERAADEQGLTWAAAAGFNPCGYARIGKLLSAEGPAIPMFSTHPGFGERSELADAHSKRKGGKGCD